MALDSGGDYLRAKAAALERLFDEHKRRLAERSTISASTAVVVVVHPDVDDGGAGWQQEEEVGRGRRYEAYVRRRDEKLRQGWRARMERKEAEVNALWARLDRGRRPLDTAAAATPAAQKLQISAKSMEYPATPRSSSVKLPLLRSGGGISSSPAAAAVASPRLSNQQALHREPPPSTPRKENRVPPATSASGGAATRPLKTLSRTRSSRRVDEEAAGGGGVRERPLPAPRIQTPRAARHGGAGGRREATVDHLPARPSADDAAIDVARSCSREQLVVLAEIRVAAAAASDREPLHLKRSGNGDDDGIVQSSSEVGGAVITGDSDTEPSYVYIKRDNEPKIGDEEEETETFEEAMAASPGIDTASSESPAIGAAASRESSESLYSNVQSSFSESAAGSPLRMSRALSTEELLEADAAMLRRKWEDDDDDDSAAVEEDHVVILPSTARGGGGVPVSGQSPVDAVSGLKRFLAFGKKNTTKGAAAEAAGAVVVVDRVPPPAEGPRLGFSDAPSDDLDYSYVISPHVRSLQSFAPSSPATSALKETAILPPPKSPRVHRSFFSFSSFKNRGGN